MLDVCLATSPPQSSSDPAASSSNAASVHRRQVVCTCRCSSRPSGPAYSSGQERSEPDSSQDQPSAVVSGVAHVPSPVSVAPCPTAIVLSAYAASPPPPSPLVAASSSPPCSWCCTTHPESIPAPHQRFFLPPALNRAKAQHACVLRPPERGGAGCQ